MSVLSRKCLGPCGLILPMTDFKPLKTSDPDGNRKARCMECEKVYHAERRRAQGKPERNLRRTKEIEGTQTCETCKIEKPVNLFPETTIQDGEAQKSCQECSNAVRAKRQMEIDTELRKVGDGMRFHRPFNEETGQKLCIQCNVWKDRDTKFQPRKDAKYGYSGEIRKESDYGYFSECNHCRQENFKYRKANDEQLRMCEDHRGRVRRAVISGADGRRNSYLGDCGCDVRTFRMWIEYQFCETMSWNNYGPIPATQWSFDHVIPLNAFDIYDPIEREIAFSWINFQPCHDNSRKGMTILPNADFEIRFQKIAQFAKDHDIDRKSVV